MAYTPDYSDTDLSASIINTIVVVILTVGSVASILVFVLIYKWGRKAIK